jgi:hypothetical protein
MGIIDKKIQDLEYKVIGDFIKKDYRGVGTLGELNGFGWTADGEVTAICEYGTYFLSNGINGTLEKNMTIMQKLYYRFLHFIRG